jgi:hypothetical protein
MVSDPMLAECDVMVSEPVLATCDVNVRAI